jgi:E1A-binding protein p400
MPGVFYYLFEFTNHFFDQNNVFLQQFSDKTFSSSLPNLTNSQILGGTPLVLSEQKRLNSLGSIVGSTNGSITPSSLNQNASTSSALSHQYNTNDQFSVKAKEEVYVLQRVQELKRGGLWTGARLPKLVEPQRQKCHWDFLLEEMQWLAADFAAEKKWKKSAAKKCSKAIQKYFQDKEMAAQRAEKAQEQNLRRIAAFIAKEVKTFWLNIKKIVEEKQQKRLEAKRQVAFNEHLKLMVDQTEQFSKQVAKGMNKKTSVTTSLNSSRISSPTPRHASDDEWMEDEDSDDDEETIAKEEKEVPESSTKDEIDALQKESEMDLDDLLKDEFLLDYLKNRDKIVVPESDSEHSNSEKEFGKRKKTEQNSDHRHSSKVC